MRRRTPLAALIFAALAAHKTADGSSISPAPHGAHHPTVNIEVANLECVCALSDGKGARCRTNAAELRVSLSGVIPGFCAGFSYEILVEEVGEKANQSTWRGIFSAGRTFHEVPAILERESALQGKYVGEEYRVSMQDSSGEYFAFGPLLVLDSSSSLQLQISVNDLHPGLSGDEALVGQRTVEVSHVKCANPEGYEMRHVLALHHGELQCKKGVRGVIHVGAHVGQEAFEYYSLVQDKAVHIECNPAVIPALRQNVSCLGQAVIHACLWGSAGERRKF